MNSTADRADIGALFQQSVRAHAGAREGIITFLRAFFDSPGNAQVSMIEQRFLEQPIDARRRLVAEIPLRMVWWKHSTTIDLGDITGR